MATPDVKFTKPVTPSPEVDGIFDTGIEQAVEGVEIHPSLVDEIASAVESSGVNLEGREEELSGELSEEEQFEVEQQAAQQSVGLLRRVFNRAKEKTKGVGSASVDIATNPAILKKIATELFKTTASIAGVKSPYVFIMWLKEKVEIKREKGTIAEAWKDIFKSMGVEPSGEDAKNIKDAFVLARQENMSEAKDSIIEEGSAEDSSVEKNEGDLIVDDIDGLNLSQEALDKMSGVLKKIDESKNLDPEKKEKLKKRVKKKEVESRWLHS